jgi:hypothetical protein
MPGKYTATKARTIYPVANIPLPPTFLLLFHSSYFSPTNGTALFSNFSFKYSYTERRRLPRRRPHHPGRNPLIKRWEPLLLEHMPPNL